MAFEKKAGARISKDLAKEMIESYEKDNKDQTRSIYFDKASLQSLLNTPDSVGVKIFFSKKDGKNTLVLVPVNEIGQPLWEDDEAKSRGGFGALNVGNPCPPYC